MKKIFFFLSLIVCSIISFAQGPGPSRTVIPYPNPGSAGVHATRFVPDSVQYLPSGCGVPSGTASLNSAKVEILKMSALYADTCGHQAYIWMPSTGTWDSLGKSGSGGSVSLDSLRTSTYFKILNGSNFAQINSATHSLAGALNATDKTNIDKSLPANSYTELVSAPIYSTTVSYEIRFNGTTGRLHFLPGSTLTADSAMVFSVAGGRLVRDIAGDYIDARWFGVVGDTVTDNWYNLQKAINYVIAHPEQSSNLMLPPGKIKHDKPLICANFNSSTHSFEFATIKLIGQSKNFSAYPTILYSSYKNAPNLIFQLNKGGGTDGVSFVGQYTAPYFPDSTYYNQSLSTYIDATVRDDPYSPECAVVVDPFTYFTTPPGGGYPGLSSWYGVASGQSTENAGSTGLTFVHGQIYNHNIGFLYSPNGVTQNCENMIVDDWFLTSVRICFVSCQSEEKSNVYQNIRPWGPIHTVISNHDGYGGTRQAGQIIMNNIQLAGRVVRFSNFSLGGTSPSYFTKIYMEGTGQFGTLIGGAGIPAHVEDFYMGLGGPGDQQGGEQQVHINATSDVAFKNGQIQALGTGLPLTILGAPSFENVGFEAVPVLQSEYVYAAQQASPKFKDCYISNSYNTNVKLYFGTNGFYMGNTGSYNKSSAYGDFKITNTNNDLNGFTTEYSVKGDRLRKTMSAGSKTITVNQGTGYPDGRYFTFTPTIRGEFQPGEPVIAYEYPTSGNTGLIGYVSDTSSGIVKVTHVPNEVISGTYTLMLSLPSTLYSFMGTTTAGTPFITKYVAGDLGISVGQQIYSATIGDYAVVKKISHDTVFISKNAAYTFSNEVFQSEYAKRIYRTYKSGTSIASFPGTTVVARGDEVYDGSGQVKNRKVCYRPGYLSTDSTNHALFYSPDSTLVSGFDSTKFVPRTLTSDVHVDDNGHQLTFENGSAVRFRSINMYNAAAATSLMFSPFGDGTMHGGLNAPANYSITFGLNHDYHNGRTNGYQGGVFMFDTRPGVDLLRLFVQDPSNNVYNPWVITNVGLMKFLQSPQFTGLAPSSDTTTFKPMGVDNSGNPVQLNRWPGSGGLTAHQADSISKHAIDSFATTLTTDSVKQFFTSSATPGNGDTLYTPLNMVYMFDVVIMFHDISNNNTGFAERKVTVINNGGTITVYNDAQPNDHAAGSVATASVDIIQLVAGGPAAVQLTGVTSTNIAWTIQRGFKIHNLTAL